MRIVNSIQGVAGALALAMLVAPATGWSQNAIAATAAPAAARKVEGFVPKAYVPKSRRDFNGLWENRGGIGWQHPARQRPERPADARVPEDL